VFHEVPIMKPYLAVFVSVLLAELGDKTQMATLLFATDASLSRWGVLIAAAGALVASTVLAVAVGAAAGAWLPTRLLGKLAAVGFIAIGVWMLVRG
jgi:putative Ca2+/H+ antiporter (TMEM165/GDT1 family)